MKFLLLHYVDETAEMDAEETREDRALLASWLENTIARGVNLQGSYLQPSRNAATIRARDGELLLVADRPELPDAESLRAICRGRIAAYKVPARIHVVAELPATDTGKLAQPACPKVIREAFLAGDRQVQDIRSRAAAVTTGPISLSLSRPEPTVILRAFSLTASTSAAGALMLGGGANNFTGGVPDQFADAQLTL